MCLYARVRVCVGCTWRVRRSMCAHVSGIIICACDSDRAYLAAYGMGIAVNTESMIRQWHFLSLFHVSVIANER